MPEALSIDAFPLATESDLKAQQPSIDDFPLASGKDLEQSISPGQTIAALMNHMDQQDAERPEMALARWGHSELTKVAQRMPFLGHAFNAANSRITTASANRIRDGKATIEDYANVAVHERQRRELEARGTPQQVLDAVLAIPGFAQEFFSTAGAYTAARGLTGKALAGLGTGAAANAVQAIVPRAAGVAAMAAANPATVAEYAATSATPGIQPAIDPNGLYADVNIGDDKSFAAALPAGFLDTMIELGSERAGGHIVGALARLPGAARISALKNGIVNRWLSKPGRTTEMLDQVLKQAGWNAVIGEVLEERVGDVARLATGLESPEQNVTGQLATGDWKTAIKQLAVEGLAFAIPGAAIGTARNVAESVDRASRLANLKAIRAKGYVSAEDGQSAGIEGDTRKQRLANTDAEIQQLEQEIQNAGTVPSPEAEIRDGEGGPDVRGNGQEQVPAQSTGDVAPEGPEVQVAQPPSSPTPEDPAATPAISDIPKVDLAAELTGPRPQGGEELETWDKSHRKLMRFSLEELRKRVVEQRAAGEDVATTPPAAQQQPQEQATPAIVAPQEQVTEPVQPVPTQTDKAPTETTGTKNVKTDELRAAAGLGERPPVEPETRQQWDTAAAKRIADDPQYAHNLANELAANPRAIDPVEEMALNRHLRDLENRRQAGEDVADEMAAAVEASERAGTVWGRSGVSRQAERAADFSLEGIVRQHIRSVNERPNDDQMAKYGEMADRIKTLEGERDELQTKLAQAEVDRQIAEAKSESRKPAPARKGAKRDQLRQQVSDALAGFKSAWAEVEKAARGAASRPTSGGLDPETVTALGRAAKAAAQVIRAYAELGVNSFLELTSRLKQEIGDISAEHLKTFKEEWAKFRSATPIETPKAEEIGPLARDLARSAVESGIEEREAVIDAVHEELTGMGLELSRSDTMQAMSGYGDFRALSKDEVSVKLRGINGEIQQLLKLEDMQGGQAPKKTGVERRTPTDEERQLIKQVNEAKKRGGYQVTDPESQLKSALASAKTAIRNRITDLETEIASRERIIKERKSLEPDAELTALRAQRDKLNEEHRKIFPPKKTGISDAQRLKMAEKSLERQIGELEADLNAGRLGPKEKRAPLTSPQIEAARTKLAQLKEAREQARAASPEYQAQEAAKQTARYKKSLERQKAFWEQRRDEARKGKLPEKRKPTPLDNEILEKKYQIELAKRQAQAEIEEAERANRGRIGKAMGLGGDLLDLSQAMMTGYEMSAVLRQGLPYALGFPKKALPALMNSVRAAFSRRVDFSIHDDLMKRPNHADYVRGGLETTATDGPLSQREELLRSRIASWLSQREGAVWAPARLAAEGLLGSERAFRSFSNTMRADLFDYMKSGIEASRPGTWSEADAKIVANAANLFSGRAPLKNGAGLSRIFFAPRWLWSRAQLMVGKPLWKGDKATRLAVGKVYVRAALGFATFQAIQYAIHSLLAGDDDHEPKFEADPRSSDFGKMRLGDTRIDLGAGMNQLVTLAARLITGQTKRASGEVVDIRGEDVPHGGSDTRDVIHRFLDTKLAPLPSAILDFVAGQSVVGEKADLATIASEHLMPMTWRDIWEAEKELDVPQGTVAALEAFFGAGLSTYGKRTKYRDADEEGRNKLVFAAFNKLDTSRPKRKDFGSQEKYDAAIIKFENDNKQAADDLRSFGFSLGEARTMLREYYLRPDSSGKRGSLRDKQTGEVKESYMKKLRALTRLYAE